MDSTDEFLDQLHDKQAKDEWNREHHGKGNPEEKLPSKRSGRRGGSREKRN